MRRGFWRTLDLDPTTDRSAIRRAYATRLKAMDVDADPDGFAKLRDARDAALAHAADPVPEAEPLVDADIPPPVEQHAPEPDPEFTAFLETIDAHYQALEALLFPGDDTPPTADELAAIDHHGRALLADPRLEEIDFATAAERWFADALSASVPRCDPLLEPAAATFGWIDRRDDYTLLPQAHAIVERIGATRFAALLSDRKHRLHKAWVELNRPDGERAPWRSPKGPRQELLSIIRTRYPLVEGWLEPQRVAAVETTPGPLAGVPIWGIVFAVVMVLRLLLSGDDEPQRPPVTPPTYLPDAAPAGVLPPAIAPPPVAEPARLPIAPVSGLTHAPVTLLRTIAQWELQVMRYYQPFDPAQCVDVSLWRPDAKLSSPWNARRTALIEQVVGHARGTAPPTPSAQFALRDGIVESVIRITGFDKARFRRSLEQDAPVADQCATQIAIRQAALDARPQVGNTLLRQLQLSGFGE